MIPLVMPQAATVTYSLDPTDTTNSIESATLLDSAGATVFTLDNQRPTATRLLAAGNYVLRVNSGFSVQENNEDHRVVFLFSPPAEAVSGQGIPSDTRAQNQADINQLLSTNSCPGGNLINTDLRNANLNHAYLLRTKLTFANLSGAYLVAADLTNANLTNANLTNADLSEAELDNANLSGANLDSAMMPNGQPYDGPVPCPQGYVPTQIEGVPPPSGIIP